MIKRFTRRHAWVVEVHAYCSICGVLIVFVVPEIANIASMEQELAGVPCLCPKHAKLVGVESPYSLESDWEEVCRASHKQEN